MTKTFRLSESIKYVGMVWSARFTAAVFGYSSIFFLEEPAKHGFEGEDSVAIVGGMGLVVFGTMFLLSIYTWVAYYVEQFTIHGATISIRSILQNRHFDVSELQWVKWRAHPWGGTVIFQVMGSKVHLDLSGYAPRDRLSIIRALHDLVPSAIQQGWPLFCHKVALPLRDGRSYAPRNESSANLCTVTRKRYDRALVIGGPLTIIGATVLWAWLDQWQFFVMPILVVIAAWLLMRFNVPVEGQNERRLTLTDRAGRLTWAIIGSWLFLAVGLALLGEKSIVWGIGLVSVATFLALFHSMYKIDKQRRLADEQAGESAAAQWQQGEVDVETLARKGDP